MYENEEDLFSNDDGTFSDSLSTTSIEIPSFLKTPINTKCQPSQLAQGLTVKKSNHQTDKLHDILPPKLASDNELNIEKKIESLNDSFGALIVDNKIELENSIKNKNSLVENWLESIPKSPEEIEIAETLNEELNESKEELNESKEELNESKEELNDSKEELNESKDDLNQSQSSSDNSIFSSDDEDEQARLLFDIPSVEKYEETIKNMQLNNPNSDVKLNFIHSLLNDIDNKYRDEEAHRFRINFKYWKLELAMKIFKIFNESVFYNKLPHDTKVIFNPRMLTTGGRCHNRHKTEETPRHVFIDLSPKICNDSHRLLTVMIHEMCHAAAFMISKINDCHGSIWRSWCLAAKMAFPLVPLTERCHSYRAKFKYQYRCETCPFVKAKHSKYKDNKICPKCKSKLILFSDRGYGVHFEVDTNKPLVGFAAFVKENYKSVRSKDVNHKQAMSILSERFYLQKLEIQVNKAKAFMSEQSQA